MTSAVEGQALGDFELAGLGAFAPRAAPAAYWMAHRPTVPPA